jgi:hypothetical protein
MFFKKKKIKYIENIRSSEMRSPVQQPWLFHLPWKMQTVVNQGLRAPDTHYCMNIKIICRWMRAAVLRNADTNHTFMCRKSELPSWEDTQNELNYCSLHFVTHFLYALEIIGHYHDNPAARVIAYNYYRSFVEEMMHFRVELKESLEDRLSDVNDTPSFYSEYVKPEIENRTFKILEEPEEKKEDPIPSHCPSVVDDDYLR